MRRTRTRISVPTPCPGGSENREKTTVDANTVIVPSPNAYLASACQAGQHTPGCRPGTHARPVERGLLLLCDQAAKARFPQTIGSSRVHAPRQQAKPPARLHVSQRPLPCARAPSGGPATAPGPSRTAGTARPARSASPALPCCGTACAAHMRARFRAHGQGARHTRECCMRAASARMPPAAVAAAAACAHRQSPASSPASQVMRVHYMFGREDGSGAQTRHARTPAGPGPGRRRGSPAPGTPSRT